VTPGDQTRAVLEIVKRALRERGLSYADVAMALGVSLPTVTRLLNKENIPLDALARICDVAGRPMADVFAEAASMRRMTFFDAAQDALFLEKPAARTYFSRLADGMSPAAIERKYGLRTASTVKYLHALERVGLIDALPGNRARLRVMPPFGFGRKSRTMQRELRTVVEAVSDRVLAKLARPQEDMILVKPLRLSRARYAALKEDLRAVIERYARLEAVEQRTAAARPTIAVVMCDEMPFPEPELRDW
jgi:transcriptional regulator with XRE-family HTH domain